MTRLGNRRETSRGPQTSKARSSKGRWEVVRLPGFRGQAPLVLLLILLVGAGCSPADEDPGKAPEWLSAYGIFVGDPIQQEAAAGVLFYELNTPLFSDYADKHRFVRLPPGGEITYREGDTLDFPLGTVIAKTFSYRAEGGGRQLLETRILRRQSDGWVALPYIWDENQLDARLAVIGGSIDTQRPSQSGGWVKHDYRVPNQNQCKGCHRRVERELLPIGPSAAQLNRRVAFVDGEENVLDRWTRLGVLVGAPQAADAPQMAVWNDPASGSLEQRARAWLDINCAHCHNPDGPARTSSLDLRAHQHDPTALGVMKTPVAAGRGSGDRLFSVVPGKPDESILIYRLESTDPGAMMPELGRSLVDLEAVDLIRQWIEEMPSPAGVVLGSRADQVSAVEEAPILLARR